MTPVLDFRAIERSFKRNVPVLNGVTFALQAGEVAGLLGRNGAGKTTLIRIAMGMLFPHGGSVRVFGASPTEDPVAIKRRIGYVAEDQVLPPGSRIAELIALHRYLFPRWDGALEHQLLDRFALQPASRIKHLSKGQARQVALLCAVCHRPELLLLDEPAGGLDPAARREFLETQRRRGTFVFARLPQPDPVHQMEEVRDTARKLLSQSYLAGLRYPGVLEILEQADQALSAPPKEEEKV